LTSGTEISLRLSNKVAIIAGGANGIGRATALLFAREGAQVVVADRDAAAGEAAAASIRAATGEAHFMATDVSRDADVAGLMEHTTRLYGSFHVLINCAGIDVQGSVVDTEPERWQRVMDVNLASIYRACRHAIPAMIQAGGGSIVNIASLQGMFGWPHYAAYAASKAGIIGLTRQIAVEYAEQNIRCNCISPGAISTQLHENSLRLEPGLAGDPSAPAAAPASTPASGPMAPVSRLLRVGRPEDVAYAALYLASDEAAHVSGHNLVVDGGASARIE
jgi:NAD(P)-dependent dehydrogenase (short-subunit alcohol dehydrogenase family)